MVKFGLFNYCITLCIVFFFTSSQLQGIRFSTFELGPQFKSGPSYPGLAQDSPASNPPPSNTCDQIPNQVCCNTPFQKTFLNPCEARQAGYSGCGPCNTGYCDDIDRPVICNGIQYQNQCTAEQQGGWSQWDCCDVKAGAC